MTLQQSKRGVASLNQAAALLIGIDPSEHAPLREVLETLRRDEHSQVVAARPYVDAAAALVESVLAGAAGSPDRALADTADKINAAIKVLERQADKGTAEVPAVVAAVPSAAIDTIDDAGRARLLEEFIHEAADHTKAAEAALLALEVNPGDRSQIDTLFRAFHTLKGASGLLGLDLIRTLAHHVEGLFDRIRSGAHELSSADADLVFAALDLVKEAVGGLNAAGTTTPEVHQRVGDTIERLVASGLQAEVTSRPSQAASAAVKFSPPPSSEAVAAGAPSSQSQLAKEEATRRGESTIRVSTERLDSLVNLVGELVVAQAMITNHRALRHPDLAQLAQHALYANKIVHRLQDLAMSLHMVPLRGTFQKMARLVRDLGRTSQKPVRFVCYGEDTEIDRSIVERLNDPLIHMIRNALDHGLEPPDERVARGKTATGTLSLRAYHSAGSVVIEVSDDGRGLNKTAIKAAAVARGLISADAELSDAEAASFIFLPGFSTVERVSEVSGRGVGMDVVQRSIAALRGRIDAQWIKGRGTTFTMHLPLTMAIIDALILKVGASRFLLPIVSVLESFRPPQGSITHIGSQGEVVRLRDEVLRIVRLGELVGASDAVGDPHAAMLVVIDSGGKRCALLVDSLSGQQQVVIKPLGWGFERLEGIAGAAVLGDGRVGLVLDGAGLVNMANGSRVESTVRSVQ